MRLAVVSSWDAGMESVAQVSWPNKVEYCHLHGYTPVREENPIVRPGYWAKFQGLINALPKYDWVCLIDVDTIIMNMAVRLDRIIESLPESCQLAFTHDAHGINMGVSLWRNSPWTLRFAEKVWACPGRFKYSPHEQEVIAYNLYAEPKDKWACLPQRTFNSYCYGFYRDLFPYGYPEGEYHHGDFLIHLPGVSNDERIRFFQENLSKVVRPAANEVLFTLANRNPVVVDTAHVASLIGLILAHKPAAVLECGVGTGYTSRAILRALQFNQKGTLTCVDNWYDSGGREPTVVNDLRALGATVVTAAEGDYVQRTGKESYDIIVSDADHHHSQEWVDRYYWALRPGGIFFAHDVANPEYPGLATIRPRLEQLGMYCRLFTSNSRDDERCDRGWLIAFRK